MLLQQLLWCLAAVVSASLYCPSAAAAAAAAAGAAADICSAVWGDSGSFVADLDRLPSLSALCRNRSIHLQPMQVLAAAAAAAAAVYVAAAAPAALVA